MRNILVAGNWKMNGDSAANAALVESIVAGQPAATNVEMLVCPPFPYLSAVGTAVAESRVELGAQNVSPHERGAYTGEVSAGMLADLGCRYVIVGHSERRALYGETSELVAAKFAAVLKAGLTPILCVGETLEDREAGNTEAVVDEQLDAVLAESGADGIGQAVVPTSRSGRSARARQRPRSRHRMCTDIYAAALRRTMPGLRRRHRFSTAAASMVTTPKDSSACRTSTVDSSVALR